MIITSVLILLLSCFSSIPECYCQVIWKTYTISNWLRDNTVVCIAIDHNNIKWFGHGTKGVTRYDDKYFTTVIYSEYATHAAVDQKNIKWFAKDSYKGTLLSYDDNLDEVIEIVHP